MDLKLELARHKYLLIITAIVLLIVIILINLTGLNYTLLGYSFDYEDCEKKDTLTYGFERLSDAQWVEGDLVIRGISNFNCGGGARASYELEGNTINLRIKDGLLRGFMKCNCDREVVFKLKELPKQEYEIKYFDNTHKQDMLRDWMKIDPTSTVKVDCSEYPEGAAKECLLKEALHIPEGTECGDLPEGERLYCYASASCASLPEDDWNIKEVCYNRFDDLCETLPEEQLNICRNSFRNV